MQLYQSYIATTKGTNMSTIVTQSSDILNSNNLFETENQPSSSISIDQNKNLEPLKIHVTNNYKMFVPHDLQRNLQTRNLERLKDAIQRHNLLSQFPIKVIRSNSDIVNDEHPYRITDGNHRFTIAKELQLPIYYMDITGNFILNDLIDTGYCLSKWAIPQFQQFYSKQGVEDYIRFERFYKDFELDIHTALPLTTLPKNRRGLSDRFRKGQFKFNDENQRRFEMHIAVEFLKSCIAYGIAKKDFFSNSCFFDGFFKLMEHPKFDQNKLMKQIGKGPKEGGNILIPFFTKSTLYYQWFKYNLLKIDQKNEI